MEPITGFATIVGLLGQFQASRGAKQQAEFQDFIEWLVAQNHEEVKLLIESNSSTVTGIKALLGLNHEQLMKRLDALDTSFAALASILPGFSDISSGVHAHRGQLSDQAKSILEQFQLSGASKMLELHHSQGVELMYLDGKERGVSIRESRFIEDDLKTLVELGLLRQDLNGNGDNIYIFTRVASELVKSAGMSS